MQSILSPGQKFFFSDSFSYMKKYSLISFIFKSLVVLSFFFSLKLDTFSVIFTYSTTSFFSCSQLKIDSPVFEISWLIDFPSTMFLLSISPLALDLVERPKLQVCEGFSKAIFCFVGFVELNISSIFD